MFLNYLDLSNILVILTAVLITIVTYLLLSSDISIFSDELSEAKAKTENSSENSKKEKEEQKVNENLAEENKVEMKGFQHNEIKEGNNGFKLGNKTENIVHLSQKINNINNKNDEMGLMFIEALSSLNSWKNTSIEKEILKKTEWNLEKRETDDEGLIYQYVYPNIKDNSNFINNNNLGSSQESINSLTETEDGEEEKERQILSSYRLGICKIFEKERNIKSNIVKEMNDKFYKIYSEGNPELIKNICKKETLPSNYDEIVLKNINEGNEIMGICGKKIKMNYLQCQKMERNKCESNMIFLGFVYYRARPLGELNPGISWLEINLENIEAINNINIFIINNNIIYNEKKTIININYFFIFLELILNEIFNYLVFKIFN